MHINLGSGPNLKPGFINIDVLDINSPDYIKWDISQGLPPQIQDCDTIYSSHLIEHMVHEDAVKLLKNVYERLKPGGRVVTVLPDFDKLITNYLSRNWSFFDHCRQWAPDNQMMGIINMSIYQYDPDPANTHKCMYSTEYAIYTHKLAGFSRVEETEFTNEFGDLHRAPYSLCVTGWKQ